ncbi:MAG: InlB B-repeat-containing protein, partial [Candidatus Bathyarchaeia archaeon]
RELVIDYWYMPGQYLKIKIVTLEGTFIEFIIQGQKPAETPTSTTQYTLTVNINGNGAVTKNPNKAKYNTGETVQLIPSAATGWQFSHWTGDITGSANPGTITMDSDKTVTAVFTQKGYSLQITINGEGTVTKNPDKALYNLNDRVTLSATPSQGWTFAGWTGDVTSSNQQITLTIDETPEVTATFVPQTQQYTLTVTANPPEGGYVTRSNEGPYQLNDIVTLTAYQAEGYRFIGWSGDILGSNNPTQITITRHMIVTAHFEKIPVTLTLIANPQSGGSIAPDKLPPYKYGDTVQLTAVNNIGYSFTGWSGDLTGIANPAGIILNGDKTVTANFIQNEYGLRTYIIGQGTVTRTPDQATYHYGDRVTLSATPSQGWTFAGWTGDVTSSNQQITLTIDETPEVTAVFVQSQYTLTVTANPTGAGTVELSPAGPDYTYGTVVTLTANAYEGYRFKNWEGALSGSTNPAQITITGNMVVTAVFERIPVTLTRYVNPAGSGSIDVSPSGPYYYGDTVQLRAVPSAGYLFDKWTGDASGGTNPIMITLNGDKTVTANFAFGTGFDGPDWDAGWDNWANPPWHNAIGQGYGGTDAASSNSQDDGPFSSNAVDTRSANTITITFKWKVQNTEATDLEVLYSYISNPNSGPNSPDFYLLRQIGQPTQVSGAVSLGNGWYQLTITLTRTSHPNAFSQYFRLRFESDLSSNEIVWVDDVKISLG